MEKNLNWAVLGTGVIANEMAQALKAMGKTLYACLLYTSPSPRDRG